MLCSLAKNSEFLSVSAWQWDILEFFWFEIWSFCTDWASTEKCPIHFSLFEVLSVHCSNISVAGTHIASKGLRLIIFCCEFSADPLNSWGAFELKTIIVCYGRGTLPLVSLTPCLKARFSLAKSPELGHWSVCGVKGLRFDRIISEEPEGSQNVICPSEWHSLVTGWALHGPGCRRETEMQSESVRPLWEAS